MRPGVPVEAGLWPRSLDIRHQAVEDGEPQSEHGGQTLYYWGPGAKSRALPWPLIGQLCKTSGCNWLRPGRRLDTHPASWSCPKQCWPQVWVWRTKDNFPGCRHQMRRDTHPAPGPWPRHCLSKSRSGGRANIAGARLMYFLPHLRPSSEREVDKIQNFLNRCVTRVAKFTWVVLTLDVSMLLVTMQCYHYI